jgi:ubiquinone/menaquinone biosynthesis C-methylase UbiE
VVVDLGSGGGFDCFLAARQVGETGKVIGVDMTPEMISRAREKAEKAEAKNVEFRLGEIEHLPVADQSADVILSNCVINLSPDTAAVYEEAFRVLKPGGRLAIADVVATVELPEQVRNDLQAYTSCLAGATEINALESLLAQVGFRDICVRPRDDSRELIREWQPGRELADYVRSATIEATRP